MKRNIVNNKIDELMKANAELTAEIEKLRISEKKLIENQQLLDSILANVPIVVWSIDLKGIFTFTQHKGKTRNATGERVGQSALEVYKGTEVETFLIKVLKEEIINDLVLVGDIYYDTRVSSIYNEKGEKTGYLGVSMDVTERIKTERLNLEKAIHESEQKYKTIVENSLEGIIIIRDNHMFFANDTFCKMLGYTRDELYTMPSVNILHPADHEKAFKIAEKRKNKDFSTIHEIFRMVTAKGKIKECETSSTLIEFDGEYASFFTMHDITEKKRMEEELVKSEQKYRELTEMLPQTVYELDKNGNIVYFNQTGFKQFGIDYSDLGSPALNFIAPSQHEIFKSNIKKTLSEKKYSFGN